MKNVYNSKFVQVYKENFTYKKKVFKDFHKVIFNDASMVILENSKKQILITREYRRGIKKTIFGFPGGHIDKNENPLKAAKRELLEETGYQASNWTHILSYVRNGTYNCGYDHIFLAKAKTKITKKIDHEINKIEWISVSNLKKMIKNKNYIPAGLLASFWYYVALKRGH